MSWVLWPSGTEMRGKLRISLVGASTRIAEPEEVKITITSFRV